LRSDGGFAPWATERQRPWAWSRPWDGSLPENHDADVLVRGEFESPEDLVGRRVDRPRPALSFDELRQLVRCAYCGTPPPPKLVEQHLLVQAKWTETILDETFRSLHANRPDLNETRLQRTRNLMNLAVRDAVVTGYEPLIGSLHLPDHEDRHVPAAAIRARAQIIVTFNLSDFPTDALADWGVEAKHPDDFLVDQFHLDAISVHKAIQAVADSWQKPPGTVKRRTGPLGPCRTPSNRGSPPPIARQNPERADGLPVGGYAGHEPHSPERGYFGRLRCSEPWRRSSYAGSQMSKVCVPGGQVPLRTLVRVFDLRLIGSEIDPR
jgi:hypothetical protein